MSSWSWWAWRLWRVMCKTFVTGLYMYTKLSRAWTGPGRVHVHVWVKYGYFDRGSWFSHITCNIFFSRLISTYACTPNPTYLQQLSSSPSLQNPKYNYAYKSYIFPQTELLLPTTQPSVLSRDAVPSAFSHVGCSRNQNPRPTFEMASASVPLLRAILFDLLALGAQARIGPCTELFFNVFVWWQYNWLRSVDRACLFKLLTRIPFSRGPEYVGRMCKKGHCAYSSESRTNLNRTLCEKIIPMHSEILK